LSMVIEMKSIVDCHQETVVQWYYFRNTVTLS
jgi:hypothetical protein